MTVQTNDGASRLVSIHVLLSLGRRLKGYRFLLQDPHFEISCALIGHDIFLKAHFCYTCKSDCLNEKLK